MFQRLVELLQQHVHFADHPVRLGRFQPIGQPPECGRLLLIALQRLGILLMLVIMVAQTLASQCQIVRVLFGDRTILSAYQLWNGRSMGEKNNENWSVSFETG